ncbi:MAG: long-chain fatty acid--CoA ligase [Candidatus Rokubacteria bacterium]|nr:long-chain fatty acid--CoA ligase [Candidatus Rokubacteria bacterium]
MAGDTLARMFWSRVEAGGERPAELVKSGAGWQPLTWRDVGDAVREAALGLLALGRRRGDAVALLSRSRGEWVHADFAILSAGCRTVPIYPSYTPAQVAGIVNDAEARTLIVEDPAQLAKALEVKSRMPGLAEIVVIQDDERHAPPVLTWADLRRLGREGGDTLRRALADRVASIEAGDVATIVYTSGTTGEPKGVVQTHANHMASLAAVARIPGVEPGDVHLLFLPLAHSFARLEAFMGVHRRLVTAFAESLDRVGENLREVRPHFIFAVPRVFEKVHAKILGDVEAGSRLRRRIFAWALSVGMRVSRLEQARRPVPAALALRRRLAHRLVFGRLHAALGGRLRFAVSGGAPLPREIAEFFHAAGILIVEGYGLTETCPALTFNRIDRFKFGSVGQPLPGVEVRVAADGEILARGPNVAMQGYWRQPAATAEAFDADGWFHTGDIGRIDEDGFVYITDRKKDLIVTSGGINIAPQLVENLLRTDPLVSQAMVYGDGRPYPTALISLDAGALARWAREHGILVTDPAALARQPRVLERVQSVVDAKNAELPSYARIKRFAVLPAELSEEAGELTPTQKVKRRIVAEKYRAALEALYRP